MRAFVLSLLFTLPAGASLHPVFERVLPREDLARATLKRLSPKTDPAQVVCARVEFRVSEELPPRLRQGFFSRKQKAPALLRFQDFGPKLTAEIAVMTGPDSPTPDTRLDFRFSTDSEVGAKDVVELAIRRQKEIEGFWSTGRTFGIEEVLRLGPERAAIPAPPAAYQKLSYYGEHPYRLGPMEAVRYRLRPCAWNPALAPGDAPGARARELRRHLTEDSVPACFWLEGQVLEAATMTTTDGRKHAPREWVENLDWRWPEAQAPFVTLAEVVVKPGVLAHTECRDFEMDPERHSTLDHRGLGSLARSRRQLGNR